MQLRIDRLKRKNAYADKMGSVIQVDFIEICIRNWNLSQTVQVARAKCNWGKFFGIKAFLSGIERKRLKT